MTMKPVITREQAAEMIKDGQTVAMGGSGAGHAIPECVLEALGRRFRATGTPRDLTIMHPFGVGNQKDRGLEHIAFPGMYRRVIGGHWVMSPSMARLAEQNAFEAYCLPAGVIVQLFQMTAAGAPGYVTEIGLDTFVDPRLEGGKLNPKAQEDLVELVQRDGREYLFYKAHPIDVSLIRASQSDVDGNLSMDEEVAPWYNCSLAQAAKASGGITIASVRKITPKGSIDPRRVRVPGIFVDYLVEDASQGMTYGIDYDPTLIGVARKPESEFALFPQSVRKVIARRAAMELTPGDVVNVGFGMPDGVIKVAREQGFADQIIPTIEQGQIGGIPLDGVEFGAAYNSSAMVETDRQFAFYHGRGVDITFLGFVEADRDGNINVSKMAGKVVGVGGFIDISQKARKVVFCGTLTAKGTPKFVERVAQVTFSSKRARAGKQAVMVVTEAAAFRVTPEGLRLEEIAPELDLERDVLVKLAFRPLVAEPLRRMPDALFSDKRMPADLFGF